MCVIMLADEGRRPTQIMVEKAFVQNPDGVGFAWRTPEEGSDRILVAWKKGIDDPETAWDMVEKLPLPYVVHFRKASCGGKSLLLTHPFPVSEQAPLNLEGTTNGYVHFHNGDWKAWQHWMLEACIRKGIKLPDGRMNDSRAIAWLAHHYGISLMDVLEGQKGVAFGPKTYRAFAGNDPGWAKVEDVWCSNDKFVSARIFTGLSRASEPSKHTSSRYCGFGECESENLDGEGFCPLHPKGQVASPPISLLPAECGGAQPKVSPFCVTSGERKLITAKQAFQYTLVKNGQGERLVSMNLYKKIRNLYSELAQLKLETLPGQARQKKIRKDLGAITSALILKGLSIA